MSVQPAPRAPFALLKLSETELAVRVAQVTETLVTLAAATVPEGLVTEQVCPDGLVLTVTL